MSCAGWKKIGSLRRCQHRRRRRQYHRRRRRQHRRRRCRIHIDAMSGIDYCISLLDGAPKTMTDKL